MTRSRKTRWILIAGPKRTDRSGNALELMKRLRDSGVSVGGFVQLKRHDATGRGGIELLRLRTGERRQLARDTSPSLGSSDEVVCSMKFFPQVFDEARLWVETDEKESDLLVIGDISKLEVSGDGHHKSLTYALCSEKLEAVVMCARADQLFYIVEKYELEDDGIAWLELPANRQEREAFFEKVVRYISRVHHNRRGENAR